MRARTVYAIRDNKRRQQIRLLVYFIGASN